MLFLATLIKLWHETGLWLWDSSRVQLAALALESTGLLLSGHIVSMLFPDCGGIAGSSIVKFPYKSRNKSY